MRALTLGFAMALIVAASAIGQDQAGGDSLLNTPTAQPGMSVEELVRSWDIDGDGKISKSEAEIARARMRRQRTELQLRAGIDPLTGLPRRTKEDESTLEPEPDRPPLPRLPPDSSLDKEVAPDSNAPSTSQPKLPSELLNPSTTKPPVPGLPRLPTTTGQPESATSKPHSSARSSRASWLPPSRTGATGVGGPRAGAPAAVPGYGSTAWSDLNAGRYRGDQTGGDGSSRSAGRAATTGGGLLPTARRPGQTGALILPGQKNPRLAPLTPALPATARPSTVEQPRVSAEDIGGYGP